MLKHKLSYFNGIPITFDIIFLLQLQQTEFLNSYSSLVDFVKLKLKMVNKFSSTGLKGRQRTIVYGVIK